MLNANDRSSPSFTAQPPSQPPAQPHTGLATPKRERRPAHLPKAVAGRTDLRWARTSVLRAHCDPFEGCWPNLSTPLTVDEVNACLSAGAESLSEPETWAQGFDPKNAAQERARHIRKIAWFARNGFQQPLEVDVGVPSLRCYVDWFVFDGNHRLAAAIVRQELLGEDPWLPLSVGGSVDYAKSLGLW